jgi:glutamyl/glutaminyl-tRNA synthetase
VYYNASTNPRLSTFYFTAVFVSQTDPTIRYGYSATDTLGNGGISITIPKSEYNPPISSNGWAAGTYNVYVFFTYGKYQDGEMVLRANIDMASPNINIRDPIIYRVAHMHHHRTGDKWCIYPMYDFAHPIEDAIEGITHSICTLEFEDHRPLYDWVVRELEYPQPPRQIEFAKLYLTGVVTGKRYIKKLVEDGIVDGWDDPRLVSISALRRRGFTPESIRKFVELCGVSKANSSVDYAMLEYCIREDLKVTRPRAMAVLHPLKLVIDNYPEDQTEELDVQNNLENEALGSRKVPFSKELWIEREDFMEEPPRKYFRLFPGNEVRLMNAYFVTCTGFEKDEDGNYIVYEQSQFYAIKAVLTSPRYGFPIKPSEFGKVMHNLELDNLRVRYDYDSIRRIHPHQLPPNVDLWHQYKNTSDDYSRKQVIPALKLKELLEEERR